MHNKKQLQLGINPSTASNRLVKDLLWNFIKTAGQDNCCKCGEPMTRETFSIEHVVPWLDSDDPVGLYFDIGNIRYSHLRCNIECARKSNKIYTKEEAYQVELKRSRDYRRKNYNPVKRRERYLEEGR